MQHLAPGLRALLHCMQASVVCATLRPHSVQHLAPAFKGFLHPSHLSLFNAYLPRLNAGLLSLLTFCPFLESERLTLSLSVVKQSPLSSHTEYSTWLPLLKDICSSRKIHLHLVLPSYAHISKKVKKKKKKKMRKTKNITKEHSDNTYFIQSNRPK